MGETTRSLKPVQPFEGGMLHTALRKGTDSEWSVILWNAVEVVSTGQHYAWATFLDLLNVLVRDRGLTRLQALREVSLWDSRLPHDEARRFLEEDDHRRGIWSPSFRLLAHSFRMADQQTLNDVVSTIEAWEARE